MLVGQYDSPFVRRAAVALHHHGVGFERRVLSTFADFEAVRTASPLGKVPVLLLPGGRALPDSRAIVEWAERRADGSRSLTPVVPAAAERCLAIEAVGIGLAEKIYERGIEVSRRAPGTQDPDWIERLETQIDGAVRWLSTAEPDAAFRGERLTRADLAVVTALTYLAEKLPQLAREPARSLDGYRRECEAAAPFALAPYSRAEAAATGWRPETADAGV